MSDRLRVAAISTIYYPRSHADAILSDFWRICQDA